MKGRNRDSFSKKKSNVEEVYRKKGINQSDNLGRFDRVRESVTHQNASHKKRTVPVSQVGMATESSAMQPVQPMHNQLSAILRTTIIFGFPLIRLVFHQRFLFPKRCFLSEFLFTLLVLLSALHPPHLSDLVCSHMALRAFVRLQTLIESSLDGFHFGGNGLEGFLIMLLPLQSFIQTLLLLADLSLEKRCREERSGRC